jgi:hypothetical protein
LDPNLELSLSPPKFLILAATRLSHRNNDAGGAQKHKEAY